MSGADRGVVVRVAVMALREHVDRLDVRARERFREVIGIEFGCDVLATSGRVEVEMDLSEGEGRIHADTRFGLATRQ